MLKKNNKKYFYLFTICFSILIFISSLLCFNISFASADSSLSVENVASNIRVVGSARIFDERQKNNNDSYYGTLHNVFVSDSIYYNENYEYGYFVFRYDFYLQYKNSVSSINDYINIFDKNNLKYNLLIDNSVLNYNGVYYQFCYSVHYFDKEYTDYTFEEFLDMNLITFVYVKDTTTNKVAYSTPIISSYNGLEYEVDGESISKSEYDKLKVENINLKKELDEFKNESEDSSFGITKILSILGIALFAGVFVYFIIDSSKKKVK